MQNERAVQVFGLADIVLDVSAVISDCTVDIRSAAHQVTQFAAEAVADRADLARYTLYYGSRWARKSLIPLTD